MYSLVDRAGARYDVAEEIIEDCLVAELAPDLGMRGEAFHGGTEDQLAGGVGIAHRADAHPVDGEQTASALPIDDSDGKRPLNLPQAPGPVLSVRLCERGSRTALDRQRSEARRPPADLSFHSREQASVLMQRNGSNSLHDRQGAVAW